MVLANNHSVFEGFVLEPCLLQPCFDVNGFELTRCLSSEEVEFLGPHGVLPRNLESAIKQVKPINNNHNT